MLLIMIHAEIVSFWKKHVLCRSYTYTVEVHDRIHGRGYSFLKCLYTTWTAKVV